MAAVLAGLPTSIPGTTVNRLCGSSLDAAIIASRHINVGDADLVLVGGAESMSRAPWVWRVVAVTRRGRRAVGQLCS